MPFLPLKDDNPLKVISFQVVTVSIIVLCVVVFLWQLSVGGGGGGAWWARIGGFLAGLLLIVPFQRAQVPRVQVPRVQVKAPPRHRGPWSKPE